jgi:hypothetical protein
VALAVAAAPILPGTPLLIGAAAFVLASVAIGWRAGIALAAILSGTPVRSGAPVLA